MNELAKVIPFTKEIGNEVELKEVNRNYKANYKTGEGVQTVEPIRNIEDIKKINDNFLQKHEYRNMLLFTLGCNLSLRASDLLQLKWGDIFTSKKEYISDFAIIEKKTQKNKYIKMNDTCKKAIEIYLKKNYIEKEEIDLSKYIFTSRKHDKDGNEKSIEVKQVNKIIKQACKEIGLTENYGSHTLRKTFCYHFYKRTGDLVTLMKMLNHSEERVTLKYIGIIKDDILATYDIIGSVFNDIL